MIGHAKAICACADGSGVGAGGVCRGRGASAPGASAPGAPAPAPPAPGAPAGPAPGCLYLSHNPPEPYGSIYLYKAGTAWVQEGTCPVVIDEGSRRVQLGLPPTADEATVRQGLTYTGGGQLTLSYRKTAKWALMEVTIPPGPAGEEADLRFTGPWGPEMAFHLTRAPTARVDTELRLGDGPWAPLADVKLIDTQPISLRFRLTGGADKTELRALIQKTLGSIDLYEPTPDTLEIAIPNPPPTLTMGVTDIHAPYGTVDGEPFTVYTGDPPTLVTPDGKGLLLSDPKGKDPQVGGTNVLRLDPATGATAQYTLPNPTVPAPGWTRQEWGPIRLRTPDGQEKTYGDGFPLGWAPDGKFLLIRWAQGGPRHYEGE